MQRRPELRIEDVGKQCREDRSKHKKTAKAHIDQMNSKIESLASNGSKKILRVNPNPDLIQLIETIILADQSGVCLVAMQNAINKIVGDIIPGCDPV